MMLQQRQIKGFKGPVNSQLFRTFMLMAPFYYGNLGHSKSLTFFDNEI